MKKILLFIGFIVVVAVGWSFFSKTEFINISDRPQNAEEQTSRTEFSAATRIYNIDVEQSEIIWVGKKNLINSEHFGAVKIKSGKIIVDNGLVSGGEFVVDMPTIVSQDLSGSSKDRMEEHLKNEDFFDVNNFPESKFVITDINLTYPEQSAARDYNVVGDLAIKDITNSISFPAKIIINTDLVTAEAEFKIDRTKWNIRYGSGNWFSDLGDQAIDDFIGFRIKMSAFLLPK